MKALPDARARAPIRFPDWKAALARAPLAPAQAEQHRRAILAFLHHCKVSRSPASVELIRRYLAEVEPRAREALQWFYRHAPREGAAGTGRADEPLGASPPAGGARFRSPRARGTTPPRAADDLGGADWERDLIAAVRARGFLWRTEQTYRDWAHRFVRFLAPPPRMPPTERTSARS